MLLLCAGVQPSNLNIPGSSLPRDAACHVSAEAVVPAGGGTAEQPMLLNVSVHNPRLVLLRRFVNNLLYVMALVNHEGQAAGSSRRPTAGTAARSSPAAPSGDASAAASSAVMLVSITNAQVRES
jgi:hypothetical protein